MSKELNYFFPDQVEKRDAGFSLVASHRIKDGEGNPIEWRFEYPNHEDFKKIKDAASERKVDKGKLKIEFNQDAMILKAIEIACVYPDLKNAELQDAYGVFGVRELIQKMLYADEINKLGNELQVKLGLVDNPVEMLEDAKN